MAVFEVDPLRDPRWAALVNTHPNASIFHTPGWSDALQRTYGYRAVVYTTAAPGQPLTHGIITCRIESHLTGKRLVSLPFADHCQPLVGTQSELDEILNHLEQTRRASKWKYIELRPVSSEGISLSPWLDVGTESAFHTLSLEPDPDKIFRNFHKSSVQRRIRHADRQGLRYESGRSAELLAKFYPLLLLMRRRHQLPPQPIEWFRNLIDCLGEKLTIYVASLDDTPVASILTLSHQKTVTYKYGCSDPQRYHLGAMSSLLWQAIQAACQQGAVEFDMGRSDRCQQGLITFKDRWGATRSQLRYYTSPQAVGPSLSNGWKLRLAQRLIPYVSDRVLTAAGRVLYRHMG